MPLADEAKERYLSFPSSVFKQYFSSMDQIVGEVSSGTLQRAGTDFGKKTAVALRRENRKATLQDAIGEINELGLGKARLEGEVIYLEESFEANAIGKSLKPACNLASGIIHGLCMGLALNYVFYEDKCKSQGNDVCVFKKRELKWYERVQAVI
jgi:predicted hydrocarbon binding protein